MRGPCLPARARLRSLRLRAIQGRRGRGSKHITESATGKRCALAPSLAPPGFLALLADFHIRMALRLWTDSSASRGMCSRQGLGKVRHLDVQDLWIQQRLRNVDFHLYKVKGEENPGDLFIKASLTHHRIESLLNMVN